MKADQKETRFKAVYAIRDKWDDILRDRGQKIINDDDFIIREEFLGFAIQREFFRSLFPGVDVPIQLYPGGTEKTLCR